MNNSRGPAKVFVSRPVEAALWMNEDKSSPATRRVEIRISRSYQDSGGVWRHTNRFSVGELPKVMLVVQEAYRYLAMRQFDAGDNTEGSGNAEARGRGEQAGGRVG